MLLVAVYLLAGRPGGAAPLHRRLCPRDVRCMPACEGASVAAVCLSGLCCMQAGLQLSGWSARTQFAAVAGWTAAVAVGMMLWGCRAARRAA